MSKQFEISSDYNKNLEQLNVSDSIWEIQKDLKEQYNTSQELLEKIQTLIKKNASIELSELKTSIEQSDLKDIDKHSFSEIPDDSLQNFMNEVLKYREYVAASLDWLSNEIIWKPSENFISSEKPTGVSDSRFARACNPTKPHHHLDGCIVGLRQSLNTWVKFTWELILDTVKLPRDLSRALFSDEYTIKDYQA
jgi:hypothetical protein